MVSLDKGLQWGNQTDLGGSDRFRHIHGYYRRLERVS